MTKIIIALLVLVVGITVLSFGIALALLGLWYLVEGFALLIAHVEFVRMFVSLAFGTWMLVIANTVMWTFSKLLNPISEMIND